jgi:hypothetical protein
MWFWNILGLVRDIKENYLLPDNEDYKGTIAAIHRLEDTYLLDPEKIRTGQLSEKYSSRPLNGKFHIGFIFNLFNK